MEWLQIAKTAMIEAYYCRRLDYSPCLDVAINQLVKEGIHEYDLSKEQEVKLHFFLTERLS